MRHCIVAALAVVLMAAAGLFTAAPHARAGCLPGGAPGVINKCDGTVQADGTWQRCVAVAEYVPRGFGSYLVPERHCDVMSAGRPHPNPEFANPPTHIPG